MYTSINIFNTKPHYIHINKLKATVVYTAVSDIAYIYSIQEYICMLLILLLVVASIFEFNKLVKTILSIIALIITILHYHILYLLTSIEKYALYPFIIIESTKYGSTLSIDYGQLMILFIIFLWRRELWSLVKRVKESRHGEPSGETTV